MAQIPLKLSQNNFTVRRNVYNMAFPPRKKRRCIEKKPGGEVEEICSAMDELKLYYGYEEPEERFRMRGVD